VVSRQKDTVALAEETDMTVGVSRCPDDAVAIAQQIERLSILDERNLVMRRHADHLAHSFLIGVGIPQFSRREPMLLKKGRDVFEAPGYGAGPDDLQTGFVDRVHIDGGPALRLEVA